MILSPPHYTPQHRPTDRRRRKGGYNWRQARGGGGGGGGAQTYCTRHEF